MIPHGVDVQVFSYILLALADGERHAYDIMQNLACRTGGRLSLGPGMLYGTLDRLINGGLIEEAGERTGPALGNECRKYYRLARERRWLGISDPTLEEWLRSHRVRHFLQKRVSPEEDYEPF